MADSVQRVRAKASFAGEKGELTFAAGDEFTLLESDDSGWSLGLLDDKIKGWFPSDRVELIKQEAPPTPEQPSKPPPAFLSSPPPPAPESETEEEEELDDDSDSEHIEEPEETVVGAESSSEDEDESDSEGTRTLEAKAAAAAAAAASSAVASKEPASRNAAAAPKTRVQAIQAEESSEEYEGESDSVTSPVPTPVKKTTVAVPTLMEKLAVTQAQAPLQVSNPMKSPRELVGKVEQLISPRLGQGISRELRVDIIRKPPLTDLESRVSPLYNLVGSNEALLSHLILDASKASTSHKTALDVYSSLLSELTKMLRLLRNREQRDIPAPTSQADPMTEANSRRLLHIYRNFIVTVAREEAYHFGLKEAFSIVLDLAKQLNLPVTAATASKDEKRSMRPSAKHHKDKVEPVDSAHEFLLQTLLDALESRERDVRNPVAQCASEDLDDIISFCFRSLYFCNTAGARALAAKCLGAFSEWHLDSISLRFTKELNRCKDEDDYREYATFQDGIKELRFRLDDEKVSSVVTYLGFLTQVESKIKSSVLRVALSASLQSLIKEMDVHSTVGGLNSTSRDQFTAALGRIFDIAKKWLKKPKTKVASFTLLMCISSYFNPKFLTSTSKFLIKMILDLLKDKSQRLEALQAYSGFVRGLPVGACTAKDTRDVWEQHVKQVLPALLVRKPRDVTPKEWKVLNGILLEMCQQQPDLLTNSYLRTVLTSTGSEYPQESRNVVLQVMGHMFSATYEAVAPLADKLQPAVTPIIAHTAEAPEQNRVALRSVLLCFPHLCVPEKRKEVAKALVPLAFSEDPELAATALNSLQAFLMLDMAGHIRFVLNNSVDYLLLHSVGSADIVSTHVANLSMLISTFGRTSRDKGNVRFEELRARLSALALCWGIHPESAVRQDACRFAASCKQHLALELTCAFGDEDIKGCPKLFLKTGWLSELADRLLEQHDAAVEGVLVAWKALADQWDVNHHVVWMLKTLPFLLRSGDDSALGTRVITHLTSLMSNPDAGVETRSNVFSALEELSPRCVESFARVATALRHQKKKVKPTMRSKHTSPELTNESCLIRAFRILASKVSLRLFDESSAVRTFVRERVAYWKSVAPADLQSLSYPDRRHLLGFLALSFQLENGARQKETKTDQDLIESNWATLALCTQVLEAAAPSSAGAPRHLAAMHAAYVEALALFARYALCDNARLHSVWRQQLMKCYDEWGDEVEQFVYEALAHHLQRQPDLGITYAARSLKDHKHAFLYTQALEYAFRVDLQRWLGEEGGPALVVFTVLVHSASFYARARLLATALANQLSREAPEFSPGYQVSSSMVLPFQMYIELARTYSAALAERAPALTLTLLQHVASTFGGMDVSQKSVLLELVAPWLLNYPKLVRASVHNATTLLQYMLSVSGECDMQVHRAGLQLAWQNTLEEFDESTLRLAVNTVIEEYKRTGSKQCLTSIASLTRSENGGASVITHLSHVLLRYELVPESYDAGTGGQRLSLAADAQYAGVVSEQQAEEALRADQAAFAAFSMLSYLALEKGDLLAPYLPVLLQNAVVQYMVENDARSHSVVLVSSLLQRATPRPVELLNDVENELHLLATAQGSADKLLRLVGAFEDSSPELRAQWASLALDWGVGAPNERKALLSLDFAQWLTERVTEGLLRRLNTALCICMRKGWRAKTQKVAEVLEALVVREGDALSDAERELAATVGYALLTTPVVELAACGLRILRQVLVSERVVASVQRVAPEPYEHGHLLRLLCDGDTQADAVWLLRSLGEKQVHVRVLVTLTTAILALTTDAGRVECAEWAAGAGTSKVAQNLSPLLQEENFHLKADLRAAFLTRFGTAFHVINPEPDAFQLAIESLLVLLRNATDTWKPGVYGALRSLIDRHASAPSPKAFKTMAELVVYDCYASNVEVRKAAESMVLDLISQYQEGVVSSQVLSLYRVVPPANPEERIAALFKGCRPGDVEQGFGDALHTLQSDQKVPSSLKALKEVYSVPLELKADASPRLAATGEAVASTIVVHAIPEPPKTGICARYK